MGKTQDVVFVLAGKGDGVAAAIETMYSNAYEARSAECVDYALNPPASYPTPREAYLVCKETIRDNLRESLGLRKGAIAVDPRAGAKSPYASVQISNLNAEFLSSGVFLGQAGSNYALAVRFSADASFDGEDMRAFVESLAPFELDVACLYAPASRDSRDIQYVSAIGDADIKADGSSGVCLRRNEPLGKSERTSFLRRAIQSSLAKKHDMNEVALLAGMLCWPRFQRTEQSGDPIHDAKLDGGRLRWLFVSPITEEERLLYYPVPEPSEARIIEAILAPMLLRFPFECEVTGQKFNDRDRNIDTLVPGDSVVLKADWMSPYFTYVGIEVFDRQGRSLANLGGYANPSNHERMAIALLLPHIKATAVDVEPFCTELNRRRKSGRFNVHLELEPIDLSSVIAEASVILAKSPSERTETSIHEGQE